MTTESWWPVAEEIGKRDTLHKAGRACCRLGMECSVQTCDRRGHDVRDGVLRAMYDEGILEVERVDASMGAHLRKYILTDGENFKYAPPPGEAKMTVVERDAP